MIDRHVESITDEGIYKSTSRLLLDHAKIQYGELSETWRDLERKAQGTIAIAGIFAAGIAMVVRINPSIEGSLKLFLVMAFTCLIVASVQAIRVLFVSEVTCIEESEHVLEDARYIFDSTNDDEAKHSIRSFVMNRLKHWEAAISDLSAANSRKAFSLLLAQRFLLGSVVFYALVVLDGVVYA